MQRAPRLARTRGLMLDAGMAGDLASLAQSELVAPPNTKPGPPLALARAQGFGAAAR